MMLETSNIVLRNEPCLIRASFQQRLLQLQLLDPFNMLATHILAALTYTLMLIIKQVSTVHLLPVTTG